MKTRMPRLNESRFFKLALLTLVLALFGMGLVYAEQSVQISIDPFYVPAGTSIGFSVYNGLPYTISPTVEYYDNLGSLAFSFTNDVAPGEIWTETIEAVAKFPGALRGTIQLNIDRGPDIKEIIAVQHLLVDGVDVLDRVIK